MAQMIEYLNGTLRDKLFLSANNIHVIKRYVDSLLSVRLEFKTHIGGIINLGGGDIKYVSLKQNIDTKSNTEAKLVGADNTSTMILCTQLFVVSQFYNIDKNILYQEKNSAILLLKNGKKSSINKTSALKIWYFFPIDQIIKGNLSILIFPNLGYDRRLYVKTPQAKYRYQKQHWG